MNVANCTSIPLLRQWATMLEAEVQASHRRLLEQANELARLRGEQHANLELELKLLEEQLSRRNQTIFGDSSERRAAEADDDDQTDHEPRKPQTGHGPRPQPALPIIEQTFELDDADRICPDCGGHLAEWDGQQEVSEEIDSIERTYRIVRCVRTKYHCSCGHIETADGPAKVIPGGRYSPDFAITVAIDKYADHIPLNRQVSQMARQGLIIDSQTLWDQIHGLAKLLRGCYQALIAHVLLSAVIGVDETRWRLLGGGKSEKRKKRWWVWAVTGNDAVFYQLQPSRETDAARRLLRGYHGTVMADGYAVYESLAKSGASQPRDGPVIDLSLCWAHARRKLVEAEQHYPEASEGIGLIRQLYRVERKANEAEVPDEAARLELREQLRREESAPVLAKLQQWILAQRTLPRSSFGKALSYIGKRWTGLTRFVEDGRIPLDNNATERAIRGPVIGRKNHYGSRSQAGTEVAAIFYSLVESAKLAGVNPAAYLREATRRALADPNAVLLPHELVVEAQQPGEPT